MTLPSLRWSDLPNAPAPGTALGCQRGAQPDGQATLWEMTTGEASGEGFKLLLLRSGDQVTAFANRCAHFGVPLAARQDLLIYQPHTRITCNVHYAHYRWHDGSCISGECDGAGLLPIPVVVDAQGQIVLAG